MWINKEVLSKRECCISWLSILKEIKNLNNNNIKKKGKNNNLNLTYSEENIDIKKCEKKKTISNNVVTKHKTEIGEGCFVGSDSQTVAPVTIGDKCYIASGSTINQDMPKGSFAISRGRQETKSGLAKKFIK